MSDRLTVPNPHGKWGPPTVCQLDTLRAVPPVVMVTEIKDNPGLSVTNNAEGIAAALVARFGGAVTIVEHYDHGTFGPDTYDLVRWEFAKGAVAANMAVSWQHLPVEDGDVLGAIDAQ